MSSSDTLVRDALKKAFERVLKRGDVELLESITIVRGRGGVAIGETEERELFSLLYNSQLLLLFALLFVFFWSAAVGVGTFPSRSLCILSKALL